MTQIKRILLLVAILIVLAGRQAFAPIQDTKGQSTKEPSTTPSAPIVAAGRTGSETAGPTLGESGSVLSALPPQTQAPQNEPKPTPTPGPYGNYPPPQNEPTPTPDCVPTTNSPCPSPTSLPYVLPVYQMCPSGYYCRQNNLPGGREGTCTINEIELDTSYRDCVKVAALCGSPKPVDISEAHYQTLCSLD